MDWLTFHILTQVYLAYIVKAAQLPGKEQCLKLFFQVCACLTWQCLSPETSQKCFFLALHKNIFGVLGAGCNRDCLIQNRLEGVKFFHCVLRVPNQQVCTRLVWQYRDLCMFNWIQLRTTHNERCVFFANENKLTDRCSKYTSILGTAVHYFLFLWETLADLLSLLWVNLVPRRKGGIAAATTPCTRKGWGAAETCERCEIFCTIRYGSGVADPKSGFEALEGPDQYFVPIPFLRKFCFEANCFSMEGSPGLTPTLAPLTLASNHYSHQEEKTNGENWIPVMITILNGDRESHILSLKLVWLSCWSKNCCGDRARVVNNFQQQLRLELDKPVYSETKTKCESPVKLQDLTWRNRVVLQDVNINILKCTPRYMPDNAGSERWVFCIRGNPRVTLPCHT